jgi:hypothetical protein
MNLQAFEASTPESLRSQNRHPAKNRLPLNSLGPVHGRPITSSTRCKREHQRALAISKEVSCVCGGGKRLGLDGEGSVCGRVRSWEASPAGTPGTETR